ncbi:MAG: ATP-binding protein [Lachnospiraceae bacterium]|nr:ATP-binding protein [Lachnospiraceae bacterium]
MKPINIYILTRVAKREGWERLERQLSGRKKHIKMKSWEMEGMCKLCDHLSAYISDISRLDFYYSFTLPKLGKEFDLLRISDDSVINIELKSGRVSDQDIRKQLMLNNYYLSMLNRTNHFFTYISGTDRLVRLTKSGRLIDTDWERLVKLLMDQKESFRDDIETLFLENEYLISPLTDTGRFLRREYFLTAQQRDIRDHILRDIKLTREKRGLKGYMVSAFTGLPGTGKTLLLYDIAMELSELDRVCVLHFGAHKVELDQLDMRLKRTDFLYCEKGMKPQIGEGYAALLIDGGHRSDPSGLDRILNYGRINSIPVIISYDSEEPIAPEERKQKSTGLIESIPEIKKYRLTNRIRLNRELSFFVMSLVNMRKRHYMREYPSVSLLYAGEKEEKLKLFEAFLRSGYTYIRDELLEEGLKEELASVEVHEAASKEYERVIMLIDDSFYYDEEGYLRSKSIGDGRIRHFYHGLNRAKKKIAILVYKNPEVFDNILQILQS